MFYKLNEDKKINVVKLIIAMTLAFTVLLSACEKGPDDNKNEQVQSDTQVLNNEAYELSKEAYDNINTAYNIIEKLGEDIYQAGREGVLSKEEILTGGTEYLSNKLNLTKEELAEGIAFMIVGPQGLSKKLGKEAMGQIEDDDLIQLLDEMDEIWEDASDEDKNSWITYADTAFGLMDSTPLQITCSLYVIGSYAVNNQISEAETALDNAKAIMKQLSNEYSNYEHYPSLKEYYTTTSDFYDFCLTLNADVKQFGTTMDEYKDDAKKYRNEIEFVFEE